MWAVEDWIVHFLQPNFIHHHPVPPHAPMEALLHVMGRERPEGILEVSKYF